jgi:hypothetical protein
VSLSSPANNQTYTAPANIRLVAEASDPDGTIARVDFYCGNILIGTATQAPYAFVWYDVRAGNYTVSAKATDDKGAVSASAARTLQVTAAGAGGELQYQGGRPPLN